MFSQLNWFKSSPEECHGDRKIIRSQSSLDDGLGTFGCLPNELLVKIFSILSPSENCRVSLTSKRIHSICEDNEVWKSYFLRQNWHIVINTENSGDAEKSWKERFKVCGSNDSMYVNQSQTQYTRPCEFEARFLEVERRRDCLIDMKYVQLKKLKRTFKVQQERLHRAVGGFVMLIYLTLIYASYRGLSMCIYLTSQFYLQCSRLCSFGQKRKQVDLNNSIQ